MSANEEDPEFDHQERRHDSSYLKQLRQTSTTLVRETPDLDFSQKAIICIDGEKFIDSGGGFLLQDNASMKKDQMFNPEIEPLHENENIKCLECKQDFLESFLHRIFNYPVCDGCRDSKDKHCLITRTEAKAEFLLKDCDFDQREPPLRFLLRKNPHNIKWGQMKLYLLSQIEERALEVWGSFENIGSAHQERLEKRLRLKMKQYNRKLKSLKMNVRSSVYNRRAGPSHQHEFGEEKYSNVEDNYTRVCTTCGFVETFEKL